jgi:hypothetical protein
MRQLLLCLFCLTSLFANATETIVMVGPNSATGAVYKIVEEANKAQKKYNFIVEFNPGREQL